MQLISVEHNISLIFIHNYVLENKNLCTSRPRKLEAEQLDLLERLNFKSDRYSSITQAILSKGFMLF